MTLKHWLVGAALVGASSSAAVAETFLLEDIQVRGLQRVALGAALTYVPVRPGEEVDEISIRETIRELYASTHFDDIQVERVGNSLVITVQERPVINAVELEGNKDLKDDQLLDSLRTSGIAEGESLDRTVISGIARSIEEFYHSVGKYTAQVDVRVINRPRNRVDLRFEFEEGAAAEIEQINVIGNNVFSREQLLSQMELRDEVPFWRIFTKRNYQQEQLVGDLENIESFYLNNGYLQFSMDSVQVDITPELESIYVTLNLSEGEQFNVDGVEIIGDIQRHREWLDRLGALIDNKQYSQAEVTNLEEAIKRYFGRMGYARTEVNTMPTLDQETNTVKLTMMVDPGQRVYVRRINFEGNDATADEVLRREMRQIEGAWLSDQLVEQGKVRLERLGYFETVEFETVPVPGEPDLVDVLYNVKEQPSGTFQAGMGYGDYAGLSFNVAVSQENFLGSGNSVGFQVDTNRYSKSLRLNYRDNYFTDDGVSLGGSIYYNDFDAGQANLQQYNQTSYGVGLNMGFPVNEYNRLNFGFGYAKTGITQFDPYEQTRDFYERYAEQSSSDARLEFDSFYATASWSRITLNRGVFPTDGTENSLSLKVTSPNSDLQYFRAEYNFRYYQPFDDDHNWVGLTRMSFGYGNGYGDDDGFEYTLPFWENFYGGGGDSLRGFEQNRTGPKGLIRRTNYIQGPPDENGLPTQIALGPEHDTLDVLRRRALGGNAMFNASIELIFPTPFVGESTRGTIRTSAFIDVSSVWDTEFNYDEYKDLQVVEGTPFWDYSDPGNYQASYGASLQWLSPMGALTFSLGFPLRSLDSELEDQFTFNIGTTF
ncbi:MULTISPECIES: outer membrane protein assembly factor BamA [Gammaproteobacteria]|uniref:outer membrane protein assembly factor BamA n=1 Tax=Gammaproteobacteria TaxID=1236 RepID=UPI000DCF95B8|nr:MULTISPECIES: outer membrane protein assembly factor BamA [Gammaproteobacteria]RTE87001.1 outer membrane protein assembly factor BamA [Aliidiomarina sp. B3213]TCZ93209.1 outer membrane protein assembly factor BamA [Lysobacter sp. N42]